MLASLKITHLVLVEHCAIDFENGLTIISGETGSGKTVVVHAIALALGERADPALIRQGEEKAIIEIAFDLPTHHPVFSLLADAGIAVDVEDFLFIRREINRSGKSKAHINSTQVSLSLLQSIRKYLVALIDQHSHSELRQGDFPRTVLDVFGEHAFLSEKYREAFNKEKHLKKTLEEVLAERTHHAKELQRLEAQWQEVEECQLKAGEEEALNLEHRQIGQRHHLADKLKYISDALPHSLITPLSRLYTTSQALLALDPTLKEGEELLNQALIATQEASNFFGKALGRLEQDPHRFCYIEERLSLIHSLSHKFQCPASELLERQETLKTKIILLQEQENNIDVLRGELESALVVTNETCDALTQCRKHTALVLEKEVTESLRRLNMEQCEFTIEVASMPRGEMGQDHILFWLKANQGEAPSLVEEHASGGELSRLLLAIKRVLAEKNETPSLMFDEIDSNVGGETAALIGKELKGLAKSRQVICITHFPQVAASGDHHIRVQKNEEKGRTVARLEKLNSESKEKELLRMMGGVTASSMQNK